MRVGRDTVNSDRRSIRLRGYGYSNQGPYFVTITAQDRESLFGDIVDGEMQCNSVGMIVLEEWLRSAEIRPEFWFDAFVVMPNHVHGILAVAPPAPATRVNSPGDSDTLLQRPAHSLGSFVAGFKSATTRRINLIRCTPGAKVWQRNYYEHIIRNDRSLDRIREYIETNPQRWVIDQENPHRRK